MSFTIKHRAVDGTETLHSAETVEVVRNGDRFMDGIFLDYTTPPTQMEMRFFKHVIRFTTPEEQQARAAGPEPKVWIMNEAGATVASYEL